MARNNDNERTNRVPENDPSKAMDSKREVENSNDAKTDQDFPGYPHYPSKEDIMDQRTGAHRVDADVENLPSGHNATGVSQRFVTAQESETSQNERRTPMGTGDDDLDRVVGRDSSGSDEDMAALDGSNAEMGTPQNVSNEDLDSELPGTDLDEEAEGSR